MGGRNYQKINGYVAALTEGQMDEKAGKGIYHKVEEAGSLKT